MKKLPNRSCGLIALALALQAGGVLEAAGPPEHKQKAFRTRPDATALKHANSSYDFFLIEAPGAVMITVVEINNSRIVSGIYRDEAGMDHTYVWVNGQLTTIDYPGANHTLAASITNSGLLFGNWGSATVQHAGYFSLATGRWTQLPDIAGYPINIGMRMSESGAAVGYACPGSLFDPPFNCRPWRWDGRDYTFLSVPGALFVIPYGINNRGQAVGLYRTPNFFRGFTEYKGYLQDLTVDGPNGTVTATAYDINDNGEILAAAPFDPQDYWPSILLNRGSYTILPGYPGVLRTFYQGMNQHGDLVGVWFDDPVTFEVSAFVALRKQKD